MHLLHNNSIPPYCFAVRHFVSRQGFFTPFFKYCPDHANQDRPFSFPACIMCSYTKAWSGPLTFFPHTNNLHTFCIPLPYILFYKYQLNIIILYFYYAFYFMLHRSVSLPFMGHTIFFISPLYGQVCCYYLVIYSYIQQSINFYEMLHINNNNIFFLYVFISYYDLHVNIFDKNSGKC